MVFVAVGYNDTPDLGGVFDEVGDVGDDQIYTWKVFPGERKTGIYNDDIAVIFQCQHVLPYFTQTA